MEHEKETIYAPATPGGGAISVIRISGRDAHRVMNEVFFCHVKKMAHAKLYHGQIRYRDKLIDDVMAVIFDAPRSYTGEDMAEIHCHGGRVGMSGVLAALSQCGARIAEPGEFTKRAYLSGKMDLSAAGAVMELIEATSSAGANAALRQLSGGLYEKITAIQSALTDALAIISAGIEYPEDDIEADIRRDAMPLITFAKAETEKIADTFKSGRMLRDGYSVVIIGRPNVGKSSLFNMLLSKERAIVTHIPGTTRDAVDDIIIKHGVPVRLVDTAGMRRGADEVEKIGIARAKDAVKNADMVLFVIDRSAGVTGADKEIFGALGGSVIVVLNKSDLPPKVSLREAEEIFGKKAVEVCAISGMGREALLKMIDPPDIGDSEDVVITNERHLNILKAADESLDMAIGAFDTADLDCVDVDLKDAWDRLGEITGLTVTEEIIDQIFDKFCLGK
ncbi:MAG: tRNA uridine-5-carboxymethylaminomethyl(34) synthesis GTPase MnmE [Eubacteriales bacterium]|nr:tRNA uridine-5-carboxymethylaminomethyl(34) synthesis GTPase MnmE [Eubacteriales bacterium]